MNLIPLLNMILHLAILKDTKTTPTFVFNKLYMWSVSFDENTAALAEFGPTFLPNNITYA